jgi:hypothetical protein
MTIRPLVLISLCLASFAFVPFASAQPPTVKEKPAADEAIDFARARELLQKRNRGEKLSAAEQAYLRRAMEARRAQQGKNRPAQSQPPRGGRESVGFKPLSEMTADDRYQGEDGGLYGNGRNEPPEEHRRAAERELAKIEPLDAEGRPSKSGTIGFISISMSNATQEFSTFKRLADADPAKSKRVTIVDCAQGGQAMAEWADADAQPWKEAERRLAAAHVSPQQVQVAWIKLANKGPRGSLKEHGDKLARDTTAVLEHAKARFPNLRIVYLGSRIYAGYSTGALNPEPFAYESAYVVRRLIRDQFEGSPQLNYDAQQGKVQAPLLLWGPYFWADGLTPRKSDGLVWKRDDLSGDGVHPSQNGREKVARLLLEFLKTDPLAKSWFVAADRT